MGTRCSVVRNADRHHAVPVHKSSSDRDEPDGEKIRQAEEDGDAGRAQIYLVSVQDYIIVDINFVNKFDNTYDLVEYNRLYEKCFQ